MANDISHWMKNVKLTLCGSILAATMIHPSFVYYKTVISSLDFADKYTDRINPALCHDLPLNKFEDRIKRSVSEH